MEFKDRLKAARKHAKLSQAELAERAGLTQTSISDLERGKSKASSFAAQIASACGVSPLWLADGNGKMVGYDHFAALSSIADHVEEETGLTPSSGAELLARSKKMPAAALQARNLAALASPRSQAALAKIAAAADSGRLTESDLILLEKIADRIASPPVTKKEGANARITRMIKNAPKNPDRG